LYIVSRLRLNTLHLPVPKFLQRPVPSFFIHWIAWIILYVITYLPTLLNSTKILWNHLLFTYLLMGTINFILFYIVAFILLPWIGIKHRRWIWLTIICLVLAASFSFLKFRVENEYFQSRLKFRTVSGSTFSQLKQTKEELGLFSYRFRTYLQFNILSTIAIIFVGFAYRLLLSWYMQEKISKDLENQKLRAELSYLKMQVNPHFLFNALNNIYSLAVSEKGKKTGDSIMKLSELLRYVLYEKEDEQSKVSLEKEIKHINSYIDLMRLRFDGDVYINFSIEGDIEGKRIAPLLLFPLIENTAKHGILTDPQKPVEIDLKVSDHSFDFSIENYKNTHLKDVEGGIGVENLQKRLDLIYGKAYTFNVSETGDKFFVDLQLPL
jgi:two-component system LytT family sensor kinase